MQLLGKWSSVHIDNIIMVIGGIILCYFPHSLVGNSIDDEGAVAIAEAVKKTNNIQKLL